MPNLKRLGELADRLERWKVENAKHHRPWEIRDRLSLIIGFGPGLYTIEYTDLVKDGVDAGSGRELWWRVYEVSRETPAPHG